MQFELFITDPVTHKAVNMRSLNKHMGLSVDKQHNSIGGFSFYVAMTLKEFETAIATPNGMANVSLFIDGKPYMLGSIINYTPQLTGYTAVECKEILQLLVDTVLEGDFELSNVEREYIPPAKGITSGDEYELIQKPYWDKTEGKGYWYAIPHPEVKTVVMEAEAPDESPVTVSIPPIPEAFYLTEDSTGIKVDDATGNRIYNRQMLDYERSSYSMCVESNGVGAMLVNPISQEGMGNVQGIWGTVAFSNASSDTVMGKQGDFIICYTGHTPPTEDNPLGMKYRIPLPDFATAAGTYTGLHAATFGTVIAIYDFSVTDDYYLLDLTLCITYDGMRKVVEYSGMSFEKALFNTELLTALGSIDLIVGTTIIRVMVQKEAIKSPIEWLNSVSSDIRFIRGDNSEATDVFITKLLYNDSDAWAVATDLLAIAGNVSLAYEGIQTGKPTYAVYDYTLLPSVPKFIASNDVFDVEYQKDFADVYNVLTARGNYTHSHEQYTYNNILEVTIRPDDTRPNRLGRLKEKVVSSSSIKDLYTLIAWADSIYDEHSYPATPIDFNTYIDDFWLSAKFGQPIVVHGLEEGKGVSERLESISIDAATGVAKVALAKRINFKSLVLEARINATG